MQVELMSSAGAPVHSFVIRRARKTRPEVIVFNQLVWQFREVSGDVHRYQAVPFVFLNSTDDVQMLSPMH